MKVLQNCNPVLTFEFGTNGHLGIDIVGQGASYNVLDTVVSVLYGKVIEVCSACNTVYNSSQEAINVWGHSYGNYVLIDHGNFNGHNIKTRYAHGSYNTVKVSVGQDVATNKELFFMGATGHTAGGHLHFELIIDGQVVDPYDYIFNGKTFELIFPTAVERNKDKRQFQVDCNDNLRLRTDGTISASVLTILSAGIYDFSETKDNDGYTWIKLKDNMWSACTDISRILEIEKDIPVVEPTPEVEEPTPEVEEPIEPPIDEYKELLSYTVLKTSKYGIKLNKNEILNVLDNNNNILFNYDVEITGKYTINLKENELLKIIIKL